MNIYYADTGKVFREIGQETSLGNVLYLPPNRKIDEFEQVEIPQAPVIDERAEKEALFRQLRAELYPPEEE